MKNIVLTGFMGTGKTETSKILSVKLKKQRLCLDEMIEWKAGKSIPEIFQQDGENVFRNIESEIVKAASGDKDVIIDAGGGAIINEENYKHLKANGVIFCLTARPDIIYSRVKLQKNRPLLDVDKPLEKIKEIMIKREEFYKKSDYMIDTSSMTPLETAEEIINKINKL